MKTYFSAMVIIPLTFQGAWNLESYSKIPPNIVTFSSSGMAIKVNQSASPIVYSFGKEKIISELIISGEFKGLPKFTDTSLQGQKKFDDYALRIGLIVSGEKRLSGIKKIFSPEWIKRIYASIPSDSGIDYVQFYESTHLVGVEFDIKPSTQDHRELVAQNDDKIYLLNIRQS